MASPNVPAFSFATSLLDWEDKYGESDFQDRFPPDFIRAESLGTQVGAAAVVLDGIFRQTTDTKPWDSGKFEFLNRTQMAMMLPHGISTWQRAMPPNQGFHPPTLYRVFSTISNFETWADDCEFVPYYEDDKAVTGAPKGVLLSSYRRGGKTLIVLGNLGDEAKMTLSLDRAKLKLPPDAKIYNAETRQELVGGTLTLPRRDFAMLLVGAPNVLTLAPGQ